MLSKERVYVGGIEESGALALGEHKVGEEGEAEEGVEWEPREDEPGPGFSESEEGDDDPVHEPWG